jgi:dTDP-4-amino-4,6-dideoxygalactose transaminase
MYKYNWINNKNIDNTLVNELLDDCKKSNIYTNYGINVKRLEQYIHNKLKIDNERSVICVANATLGLYALCNSIELYLKNKDFKWTTQSFTFPSSAQGMLNRANIEDIDKDGGLDISLIPSNTDGIIVTNIFGNVVDIDKYTKWCDNNNTILIFDNAATPYTFYKGKNCCNYGDGCIISFHHTKPLGFGEGGAIIVNKKYEEYIRRLINFGIHNEKNLSWLSVGSNYKMSEISAIYILQYMTNYFDKVVEHHTNMYKKYRHIYNLYPNFADKDGPILVSCICLIDDKYDDTYITNLLEKGIMCRKYYKPLLNTPIATEFYKKILCYPCNLDIKDINLY